MQEFSKGNTLDIDQEKEKSLSAFKNVSRGLKHSSSSRSEKRDSGYVTDNSPANFGGNLPYFTFDTDAGVGPRGGHALHPSVDEDEEVEMVLNSPSAMGRASKPIPINRPRAPLPRDMLDSGPTQEDDDDVFENASNVCDVFNRRRFRNHAHHFRPIHGRTIGTQTPSQHGQAITETINFVSDRFHPYQQPPIARGTAYARLRYHSDGDGSDSPTHGRDLPDLVPVPRDRSISLPDVHHQQRLDVGRELRRIGDEFHFELASAPPRVRRNGVVMHQAASFPGTTAFNFQNWWEQLRTIFSSPVDIDPGRQRRRAASSVDPGSIPKDF